jgi:hypothetical protein
MFISPRGEIFPFSFKFQFDNTNNTIEFEALLGMQVASTKGIKDIHE